MTMKCLNTRAKLIIQQLYEAICKSSYHLLFLVMIDKLTNYKSLRIYCKREIYFSFFLILCWMLNSFISEVLL